MKSRVSAEGIVGLPGVPKSVRGVQKRAEREGWAFDLVNAKGGPGGKRKEYHVSSLPPQARAALLDRAIEALPAATCPLPAAALPAEVAEVLPAPAALKGWQRRAMEGRGALLAHLERLAGISGVTAAVNQMVRAAKTGTLPDGLQELVRQANARGGKCGGRTLSASSLYRWRRQLAAADGNPAALAPVDPYDDPRLPAERRAAAKVPAWAPYFLRQWRIPSKPSIPDALEEMGNTLPAGIEMPSYSQAYRFVRKMSNLDREKGRRTGKELRAVKGYRQRDTSDMEPCEVYQCDGHSFKARVAHPVHGKPFHPEVCACVDAATRLAMGWSAGLSESNQTVADALRHACMVAGGKPGGIPAILYTDPGAGNKADINADPALGRYARLGITFKTGIVGNSQARGLIEAFQKNWIKAAKRLPTYDGKDMDSSVLYKTTRLVDAQVKKTGRSELLPSWPQFLDHCAATIEAYNNRPHSALPKITDASGRRRHMTPMEAWNTHLARGFVPPTLSQTELDDCFRPRIEPTTRRGEVRVFGNTYYHKELEHYNGEKVWVEYEVQDGARVWVRDHEERLICIAGFESHKSRMFAKSATEEAAEKREARRLAVVQRREQEIREERRGTVEVRPPAAAEIEQARAQFFPALPVDTEPDPPTKAEERVPYFRALRRRMEAGAEPTAKEAAWLGRYRTTSEYLSLMEVEADLAPPQADPQPDKGGRHDP